MKITLPGLARASFYDRNSQALAFHTLNQNTAPHAVTDRWTYTVPAGRKSQMTGGSVVALRITAAAPVGIYRNFIEATLNFVVCLVIHNYSLDNTVGGRSIMNVGTACVMGPGDVVKGRTLDASTGGTVDYDQTASFLEFDA